MIVVDTSVFVDAIIPFRRERHELSLKLFDTLSSRNVPIVAPLLLVVELSGVLARYKPASVVEEHVSRIAGFVNLLDYSVLHEEARRVALSTGCRAADAFFIAAARVTGSILVSSDRRQVSSARHAGVEAYYLLDEFERILARVEGVATRPEG